MALQCARYSDRMSKAQPKKRWRYFIKREETGAISNSLLYSDIFRVLMQKPSPTLYPVSKYACYLRIYHLRHILNNEIKRTSVMGMVVNKIFVK
uniref:Major sperm protein n=1 Tax=Parascaris univalens TaxID=6257 RepID=A0A915BLW8_PARUN